jgi:hypothetical protein
MGRRLQLWGSACYISFVPHFVSHFVFSGFLADKVGDKMLPEEEGGGSRGWHRVLAL